MTSRSIVSVLVAALVAVPTTMAQQTPGQSPAGKPASPQTQSKPAAGQKVVPQGAKNGMRTGVVDMATNIGSFKIVSPGNIKAFGKMVIEFTGTVLIVGLNGSVTPSATLRKEYSNAKHERVGYFGTGRLTVEGEWTALQFFGRKMKAHWEGLGICRLYGEFDEKLETGTYTIAGDKTRPWMQGGNMFILPREVDAGPTPRVKKADG